MPLPPPTYRNRWAGSGDNARSRAKGSPVLTNCFRNLPSLVNIWTRRYSRSATYTGAVFGDADGGFYADLLRGGIREAGRRDQLTVVVVHRLVAECAPHPLELASVRVEDNDAVIAVAVGHEQFVGRLIDPPIGRA